MMSRSKALSLLYSLLLALLVFVSVHAMPVFVLGRDWVLIAALLLLLGSLNVFRVPAIYQVFILVGLIAGTLTRAPS